MFSRTLLFSLLSSTAFAQERQIVVMHDGTQMFCATEGPTVFGFDSGPYNFTGTCHIDPGECTGPIGLTRLSRSDISYGAVSQQLRRNVDLTEWNNIWGHGTANAAEPIVPWPGVNGAGPVIRSFGRQTFVAAHFNTGSSPIYLATLTDQSNIGGPDIDVVMSATCGDFSPNPTYPGCSRFSMPSDGITHFNYFSNGGNAGQNACPLDLNTDYYLNIKLHDPTSPTDCSASNPICPLFTINYWAPWH